MSNAHTPQPEPSAVDDVRRVREKIADQHRGNLRQHMEKTNRIFEQFRSMLNLKLVPPPKGKTVRSGT